MKYLAVCLGLIICSCYAQSLDDLQKNCDAGNGISCTRLGTAYSNAQGVKMSDEKAREYYEKACDLNEPEACTNLGVLYENGQGVEQSSEKAKSYYQKACNLKESFACEELNKLKTAH